VRHYLVQVEEGGRCVLFVEPERRRHNSLAELLMASTTLTHFAPGVPKTQCLAQLQALG
jgi:hypothetical protein